MCPVDGLRNAGLLEEIFFAEPVNEGNELTAKLYAELWYFKRKYLLFRLQGRVIDPVIQASPPQSIVNLTGAVRGDDDDRRSICRDGAKFRDCELEVGQELQEECLERLISAVDLVDQQHGRAAGMWL